MKFFVILNNQQEGPYTIAQLAEMGISSETLVWKEGMKDWQPAWTISELRYILNEKTNEYRNASSSGMQQETAIPPTPPSAPYKEEKKPQNHYLLKIFGGLVLLLLIIMALTNPNKESHENAIRTEVSKAVEKATTPNGNDIFSQGFGMMARMLAGNFIDSALDNLFEYHNYLIFSKGTVTIQDKEHTVSYGIFGKVITMNSDDMVKALEGNNPENTSSDEYDSSENTTDEKDLGESTTDERDLGGNIQKKLEDRANQAMDKAADKVSKKIEEKINQKIDQATDSTTIDKIIDKIMELI